MYSTSVGGGGGGGTLSSRYKRPKTCISATQSGEGACRAGRRRVQDGGGRRGGGGATLEKNMAIRGSWTEEEEDMYWRRT